ncbi:MAG: M14 family metallopeptidase [Bdellovibrionota bacterium]
MLKFFFAILFVFSVPGLGASYYSDSYVSARKKFRDLTAQAKRQFEGATSGSVKVPSKIDDDLTIDYLYLPPKDATEGLVIVSSGVHGVEAYAGSAMQHMLLDEFVIPEKLPNQKTGYLFIHAINPYGFKYGRRVSENSVDLNRNFGVNKNHFDIKNPQFTELKHLLMPAKPASSSWVSHIKFLLEALMQMGKHSVGSLKQAIAGGQYEYPKGIFYGGRDFEPNQQLVEALFVRFSKPYAKVLNLDLHTGFGKRGFMHLFPNPTEDKKLLEQYKHIFGNYPIEEIGEDFYSNEGDFSTYVAARLAQEGKTAIPMLVEYGTLDSQTYRGAIASLSRMVLENQKHWYGARRPQDATRIQESFMELFYPSAEGWRDEVERQTRIHLPRFIENFDALEAQGAVCADEIRSAC